MNTFLNIVVRLFSATVVLLMAAIAIFAYAHVGSYGMELIALWCLAALGSLFWIFRPLASVEKKE